jgi:hypothetical protein
MRLVDVEAGMRKLTSRKSPASGKNLPGLNSNATLGVGGWVGVAWRQRPGSELELTPDEPAVLDAVPAAALVEIPPSRHQAPAVHKSNPRRRPAQERVRQLLKEKAPQYINSPDEKTYWEIASMLVGKTAGANRTLAVDAMRRALERYYTGLPKDRSRD